MDSATTSTTMNNASTCTRTSSWNSLATATGRSPTTTRYAASREICRGRGMKSVHCRRSQQRFAQVRRRQAHRVNRWKTK
ncbi:unnamed protein product, partial [Ectocarpus sp. 12 AP-2014]